MSEPTSTADAQNFLAARPTLKARADRRRRRRRMGGAPLLRIARFSREQIIAALDELAEKLEPSLADSAPGRPSTKWYRFYEALLNLAYSRGCSWAQADRLALHFLHRALEAAPNSEMSRFERGEL
jgi:hypothetical protein